MNLNFYVSPNTQVSIFRAIPICRLNEVKELLKNAKIKYRVKYRGPRKNDGRYRDQQQRDCLRKNATHFAVYSEEDLPYYGFNGTYEEYCQYVKDNALNKLGLI